MTQEFDTNLINQLLEGRNTPEDITGEHGLLKQLTFLALTAAPYGLGPQSPTRTSPSSRNDPSPRASTARSSHQRRRQRPERLKQENHARRVRQAHARDSPRPSGKFRACSDRKARTAFLACKIAPSGYSRFGDFDDKILALYAWT